MHCAFFKKWYSKIILLLPMRFFLALSGKAMLRCSCFNLMSFGFFFSSSPSPDYVTPHPPQKRWYVSSFSTLKKRSEAWQRQKQRCKVHPADFLICLSGINPGTGIAGPPTSRGKPCYTVTPRTCHCLGVVVTCTLTVGGGKAVNQMSEEKQCQGSSWKVTQVKKRLQ